MKTLRDQLNWEKELVERGAEKYYAQQDRQNGDESDVGSYIIKQGVQDVAKRLHKIANMNRGSGGKYNKLLRTAVLDDDYERVAFIGLKTLLNMVSRSWDKTTPLKACLKIATRLEMDLKCQQFEALHPDYYFTVMQSMEQQHVKSYEHTHKVVSKKFHEFGMEWKEWATEYKVQVGSRVMRCILEVFHDVFFINKKYNKGKTLATIETRADFDEWSAEFQKVRGLMRPVRMPLMIPPKPYDEYMKGGYFSMGMELPFIKSKPDAKEFIREHIPEQHIRAVNKIQNTAWCINKKVYEVQQEVYRRGLGIGVPDTKEIPLTEFPEHLKKYQKGRIPAIHKEELSTWKALRKSEYGRRKEQVAAILAYKQTLEMKDELIHWDEFYFAYNCDFRGRIYCASTGLSPQGQDFAKGLLQFKKGVVLGESGVKWLAIQGANVFGNDKISYDDRVQWIKDNELFIRRTVEDPLGYRDLWTSADKPYQFLAFCFEWESCDFGRLTDTKGYIPVGLDGSCNGLQHYSAILRDSVGARSVNLTDNKLPEDIYGDVAKVTIGKLKGMTEPMAGMWLKAGINRKCSKKPVMTLPYGSTQTSARLYVLEWINDNWSKFELSDEKLKFQLAKFLTPILWASIGEVVIAARVAMDYLKKQTRRLAKDECVRWVTHNGFPVWQSYLDAESTLIETKLCGTVKIFVKDFEGETTPLVSRQVSGVAPNFVHSVDATHLVMTTDDTDFHSYAMIHDDFGTHAGNTETLFWAIRESFYNLHSTSNLIEEWAKQTGADLDALPDTGDYDIEEIDHAMYFFG